jgi:hypothetical protein
MNREEDKEKPETKTNLNTNEMFKMNYLNTNEVLKSKEKYSSFSNFIEVEMSGGLPNTMNAMNNPIHRNNFFNL